MKNDLLPVLRQELENSFGRKIVSSRDCLQMVDDIYQKTGYTINANTLRRFFGLVQTPYSASPSTLNILSKYCGFNSIDELENLSSTAETSDSIQTEEVLHYLVSLFKNMQPAEGSQPLVGTLVQQTVTFLDRNEGLIERFQREIANTAAGQLYYFEKAVNMDRLNSYYGNGLRYYLRAKNNNEARVFACSVQVLRHWLSDNGDELEKNMSALTAVPLSIHYPAHILARSIAARIYYAQFRGEIPDRILQDATRYYAAINARVGQPDPEFDLIVGEALILTNHITEGNGFIRRGKAISSSSKHPLYESQLAFWEKLVNSRKPSSIKIITGTFKPGRALPVSPSPLNKKYFSLLSLTNDGRSKKSNLAAIIKETGFARLMQPFR